MTWYWYGYSIETIVLIVFLTIYDLVLNRMWEIFLYLSNYLSGSCQGYCTSESSKKTHWHFHFWLERWNLVSLCDQHRRCGVVKTIFVDTLSSLKARLRAFCREKSWNQQGSDCASCGNLLPRSKVGMAWPEAINRIRLKLTPGAKVQPLFKLSLGYYWSQAWGTWPDKVPPRDHKWDTWTGVFFIWPRLQRPGEGPLFESDTNKRRRVKVQLLFKLSHGQLLKSSLEPDIALIRCMIKIFGDHKFKWTEVLPSDPRLELPGEGSLFKSNSNKCWGPKVQPQFELSLNHY